MNVFVRLSPSRVEKFLECPARWGFAELPGGTPEPGSEATDFGTETHKAHELYYKHGKPYDTNSRAGYVAAAMAPHLPRVLPIDGGAELELTYPVDGVVLRGTLDLCWPQYEHGYAVVRDYKTTGGFGWAKLERDALFGHSQAPLYALMMMNRHGYDFADLSWIYALRPPLGPPPWPRVEVQLSSHIIMRAEAEERVHLRMVPPAKQMQAYADAGITAATAHTLPKNLTACRKYNRWCHYLSKCQPQKDRYNMNPFLASIAGAQAPATNAEPSQGGLPFGGNNAGAALDTLPGNAGAGTGSVAQDKAPAINPPEGGEDGETAGKRKTGKGKSAGSTVVLDEASLESLAERVVDKLALRLTRGIK